MREYIVKPGDTLYEIAQRECGSLQLMEQIRRDNDIANPSMIYVGQRLHIRCDEEVLPPYPPSTGALKVPYYPQIGLGANWGRNDCGPACIRMLVGWNERRSGHTDPADLTVDKLYQAVGATGFTGWNHLIPLAARYRLTLQLTTRATIDNIKREIDAGRPVMPLVLYGMFTQRMDRYSGGHYVVVVGYTSDSIIMHDPLWYGIRAAEGESRHIPTHEFEAALSTTPNPYFRNPYQALIVKP